MSQRNRDAYRAVWLLALLAACGAERSPDGAGAGDGAENVDIGDATNVDVGDAAPGNSAEEDAAEPDPRPVSAVAVGGRRACAVAEGDLYCWGRHASQLADVTQRLSPAAPEFTGFQGVVDIGMDRSGAVVIANEAGEVYWAGAFGYAVLGAGDRQENAQFSPMSGIRDAVEVATSRLHGCAVTSEGEVWCWGVNGGGAVRPGERSIANLAPEQVVGVWGAADVAVGEFHTCALLVDGSVTCWGSNAEGQMGAGSAGPDTLSQVSLPDPATAIGAAADHTCVVTDPGDIWCWGSNRVRQFGSAEALLAFSPIRYGGSGPASGVAVGEVNVCAILEDGGLECAGSNEWGIAPGADESLPTPVAVGGVEDTQMAAVGSTTCAIDGSSRLWCWGSNEDGAAGQGLRADRPTPVEVELVGPAREVDIGDRTACAVMQTDEVVCWGDGDQGILGVETGRRSALNSAVPLVHETAAGLSGLSVGWDSACGLATDGSVHCWGAGSSFQLGDLGLSRSDTPVEVETIGPVDRVSVGRQFACALERDGDVWCWGANGSGVVGTGDVSAREGVTQVDPRNRFTAVTTSSSHACGATRGQLGCWGNLLPNLIVVSPQAPFDVMQVAEFAAGNQFTCAIDDEERVWRRGDNTFGQIDPGDLNDDVREELSSVRGATGIVAGYGHACALLDGVPWCWGANEFGQLGRGTYGSAEGPGPASLREEALALTAAGDHTCALTRSGRVFCWGVNRAGEMGDGGGEYGPLPPALVSIY